MLVSLKNLTLRGGKTREGYGGALRLRNSARVTVENVTFADNSARAGGAIYTATWNVQLDIQRSRFIGMNPILEAAPSRSLAELSTLATVDSATIRRVKMAAPLKPCAVGFRVWNSTFSHNRAYHGGGIYVRAAEVTLTHVTLAGTLPIWRR